MKLLLDENLPHALRYELSPHDCFTVAYMGWAGREDNELLSLAAASGFDALLTQDAGLQYQQNLRSLPLSIVVLRSASNDMDDLRPIVPTLLRALSQLGRRTLVQVP
jgi:predicted nuclease of predicted toxin-antitoxin system